MSDAKVPECDCVFRKKIEIMITDVKSEAECGVSDLELGRILDWDMTGPNGEPVLRIRYCPWCGKKAPKPERITHLEVPEDTEGEEWKNPKDEDEE